MLRASPLARPRGHRAGGSRTGDGGRGRRQQDRGHALDDRALWVQSDLEEAKRRGIARDGGTNLIGPTKSYGTLVRRLKETREIIRK